MLKKINLKNVATYDNESIELRKINFIYGNNGTGKTTISRYIDNPSDDRFKYCSTEYDEEGICDRLIYNQDFVKSNFNAETQLRGIYTFGEESEEKYKQIEKLKKEKETLIEKKKNIYIKKNECNINLNNLKKNIYDILWNNYKKKYCDKMPELFKRNIGTKENFYLKCISTDYEENVLEYEKIISEYNLLYKEEPIEKNLIHFIELKTIVRLKKSDIFKIEIIENKDVKLSKLIDDLNNGIWIENGLKYLKYSSDKCPFCQQEITKEFINKIYSLYEGKYKQNKNEFSIKRNALMDKINEIKDFILDNAAIIDDAELIANVNSYCDNIAKEVLKKEENLRYKCEFPTDDGLIEKLEHKINNINNLIKENNDKIKLLSKSREELSEKSWKFIRNECNKDIEEYMKDKMNFEKDINTLIIEEQKINNSVLKLENDIKLLENSITSITKTINNINEVLKKFNYINFKLVENDDHLTYSIVRDNNEDASKTLSEGEFSFISFLYFYNLIFGSRTRSGLQTDHVLVIDDPVTSMDNNTLFIISTLIRQLIDLCINNQRNIKQIFILSHNLYFFKEVTYEYDGKKFKNKVGYFVSSKINGKTLIKSYQEKNPIRTSYELLWSKLREKNYTDDSNLNAMRRILEQLLKSMGLKGPNNRNKDLINKFDDKDKIMVKSLLTYINDGSHSIMDGLYISQDEQTNENAFRVFKKILKELGFEEHYKLMMGEKEDDNIE